MTSQWTNPAWAQWAHFDVSGTAVTLWGFLGDIEFFESRVPYTVDVMLTLDLSQPVDIQFEQRPDFYSDLNPTTPSDDYENNMDGMLTSPVPAYDQATVVSLIAPKETVEETGRTGFFSSLGGVIADHPFAVIISLLMLIGAAGTVGYTVRLQTEEDAEEAVLLDADEGEPGAESEDKRDSRQPIFLIEVRFEFVRFVVLLESVKQPNHPMEVPMPSSSVTLLCSCMM